MADDLLSEAAHLGAAIPGFGALATCVALALWLGRHIGVYEKARDAQDEENERLRAAVGKVDGDLVDHKRVTDERVSRLSEIVTDTRLALAKLPDREELRAWFADMRDAIERRTGT